MEPSAADQGNILNYFANTLGPPKPGTHLVPSTVSLAVWAPVFPGKRAPSARAGCICN